MPDDSARQAADFSEIPHHRKTLSILELAKYINIHYSIVLFLLMFIQLLKNDALSIMSCTVEIQNMTHDFKKPYTSWHLLYVAVLVLHSPAILLGAPLKYNSVQ